MTAPGLVHRKQSGRRHCRFSFPSCRHTDGTEIRQVSASYTETGWSDWISLMASRIARRFSRESCVASSKRSWVCLNTAFILAMPAAIVLVQLVRHPHSPSVALSFIHCTASLAFLQGVFVFALLNFKSARFRGFRLAFDYDDHGAQHQMYLEI